MNYEETLQYLSELGKFGSHLGLERIQGLLVELDHPERRFNTIHIIVKSSISSLKYQGASR